MILIYFKVQGKILKVYYYFWSTIWAVDRGHKLLQETIKGLSGKKMSKEDVKELIVSAKEDVISGKLAKDLQEIAPVLPDDAKQLVLKASMAVAAADGELDPKEQRVLDDIIRLLQGEPIGSEEKPGAEGKSEAMAAKTEDTLEFNPAS